MPPATQQSTRAGLITAVVVFVVLFITATIFAIYFGVQMDKARKDIDAFKTKAREVVEGGNFSGTALDALKEARAAAGAGFTAKTPLLDVALAQRNSLGMVITGKSDLTAVAVEAQARQALDDVAKKVQPLGLTLPSTSGDLTGAVLALADALAARQDQVAKLTEDLKAAQSQTQAKIQEMASAISEKDKQVSSARADADKATGSATAYQEAQKATVTEIQTGIQTDRNDYKDGLNKLAVQLQDKDRQIIKLNDDLARLRSKLGMRRPNVAEAIARQADGTLIRVPGNDIVYISRGQVDGVLPGLTFEVYDRQTGIPKIGDPSSDENLPAGKASIEVLRVGANTSEARVINQTQGMTLVEGDLIANLVFDPNTKYSFLVFGKFDLDQNNVPTAQDTEVVKKLISQWGGRLMDNVNVATDFVVLGAEPVIPEADPEDPLQVQQRASVQQELDQYNEVRRIASELHVPVLNQNRFLYLIGYYESADR